MVDDRSDECRHGVVRRHDRGVDRVLRGGFGGEWTDRGDRRGAEQINGWLGSERFDEVSHGGRAREGDDIDSTFEQHAIDVRIAVGFGDHGPVGDDFRHVRALLAQLFSHDQIGRAHV